MNKARLLKIVLPSVLVLVLAAAAFAWFTGGGGGSATASSDNPSSVAVTLSAGSPSSSLYPGGNADVAVTLTNANSYPVHVDELSLDTSQGTNGFDVDNDHATAGCDVSALSFNGPQNAGWTVPAHQGSTDGSLSVHLSNAVSMASSAADACQGASFTVYLKTGA